MENALRSRVGRGFAEARLRGYRFSVVFNYNTITDHPAKGTPDARAQPLARELRTLPPQHLFREQNGEIHSTCDAFRRPCRALATTRRWHQTTSAASPLFITNRSSIRDTSNE